MKILRRQYTTHYRHKRHQTRKQRELKDAQSGRWFLRRIANENEQLEGSVKCL